MRCMPDLSFTYVCIYVTKHHKPMHNVLKGVVVTGLAGNAVVRPVTSANRVEVRFQCQVVNNVVVDIGRHARDN